MIIKVIRLKNLTIESKLLLNNRIEIPGIRLGIYYSPPSKDTRNAVLSAQVAEHNHIDNT